MTNVKIRAIDVYHPEKQVENKYYLEHFEKQGKDIDRLLKAFGKDKRYIIDNLTENTLTMGIEASKKALKKAGLTGEDIDLIIFTSQFPEYTIPPQSLMVHRAINGKAQTFCTDSNADCVGMIVAFDYASRYLQNNKDMNKALIIGSDYISVHCREYDEYTYPLFGDSACAVILEKTEEDCGFVDSFYSTNSENPDIVKFPASGSSKIYDSDINERKIHWTPFDGAFIIDYAKESVDKLLQKHSMNLTDIDWFCFSQFALPIIDGSAEKFGVDRDKFIYVGNKYGYTGTSSPFIALYEGIENGQIKRGDNVAFWSIGGNWITCAMLIKY
ncbi:3-oxoacyl-ACP synthase III family protein [Clostridium sp. MSJ-4]|uniref:3-oxoacyl-ACP synthase III family protein n=1 Tax=Clostridium simiarum TaxID=2841506 RepID=A0ABS6F048_9CLOT|nr:3-oxoacyl-ACP synthase III family protein [Clostridium simiarum]MBU5591872.1 3-oxoacyl-ACP synthase III family protein [Clostridium simiarum]